ncbi:MAG: hypothetical protein GX443_03415 [Deltaproteobacteria bacterium]|nr:hypothetical protein [Deltaproteobacteria bacterium]
MVGFVYALMDAGIPVSVRYLLEFTHAIRSGMARDLDQLFLLARLVFVKRVEHCDTFEQVFASYFFGADPAQALIRWEDLLSSKPFHEWLRDQVEQGKLSPEDVQELDTDELLARFWETVLAQEGAHHGGNRWVGTRGGSPYGHAARHPGGGIRVQGKGIHGTAQKVIGARRFVSYSDHSTLSAENLRQALQSLRSLRPSGPETELDLDETIARTAKNGGEIELVFGRELRNRVKLIVLMDNGGYSMTPYIPLVRTLFNNIRGLFADAKFCYFHNCIYGVVFRDPARTDPVPWEKLMNEGHATRLIIVGDANMAPAELMACYGSLDLFTAQRKPGVEWLRELRNAFPVSVWLNPIEKARWGRESTSIQLIRRVFHMEDLTLAGIKNAVTHLNLQGQVYDRLGN